MSDHAVEDRSAAFTVLGRACAVDPHQSLLAWIFRIPASRAEDITGLAEAAIAKENLARTAILQGIDPQEACIRHGKF